MKNVRITLVITRPDSQDLIGLVYTFMVIRAIFSFLAITVYPVGIFIGFALLYNIYEIKSRYYIGLQLLPILVVLDLLSSFLLLRNAFITNISIILAFLALVFYIVSYRERKVIARPMFTYNVTERRKARKAIRNRNPDEIAAISKYQDWEKSPDPNRRK